MPVGREAGPDRVAPAPLSCVMCGQRDAMPDRAVCRECNEAGYAPPMPEGQG